MAEADPATAGLAPPPPRRKRIWWPLRWLVGAVLGLVAIVSCALLAIDTDAGHRLIVDRIAALQIKSGLRIRIGRIDGSIWGETSIRDLRLYDPQGLFLEIPELRLDWHPLKWTVNRLDIDRLSTDLAVLHRKPKLIPSATRGPILPGFDVRIGQLDIRTLRFGPAIAGQTRAARVTGRADIRDGRALIDLKALVAGGGDRLSLLLDAEPDRDRFDLDARLTAPAGGVFGKLIGTARPVALAVGGDGRWSQWNGKALLDVSGPAHR